MSAADNIAATILEQGRIRAQGLAAHGDIYGHLAQSLGQIPGQVLQQTHQFQRQQQEEQTQQQEATLRSQQIAQGQYQQDAQKRAQEMQARVSAVMQSGLLAPDKRDQLEALFVKQGVPFETYSGVLKALNDADASREKVKQARLDHLADWAHTILADKTTPDAVAAGLAYAQQYPDDSVSQAELKPLTDALNRGEDPTPILQRMRGRGTRFNETMTVADGGQVRNKGTGALIAENPKEPNAVAAQAAIQAAYAVPEAQRTPAQQATIRGYEGELGAKTAAAPKSLQAESVLLDGKPARVNFHPDTGKYTDTSGADVSTRVKPLPPASVVYPGAGNGEASNVKEAIAGMKDGTIPPQMPGRASKDYTAIMAEAHRQGFDLAAAATDWAATQKHFASLNSNQQLRLNQAIGQLPELLDSVDDLASKWKAGRFPLLNRANLALAKNGLMGKDAASIANQLSAQIADVTGDLGAVYMGGNSPTDHALGLAAKALGEDWDEKVLRDMTKLARQNVQTRLNSMRHTEAVTPSSLKAADAAPATPVSAPVEGATKPIEGYPGTEQTYRGGKWIRTK